MAKVDYPPTDIDQTQALIKELEDKMAADQEKDKALLDAFIATGAPQDQIDALRKSMGLDEAPNPDTGNTAEPVGGEPVVEPTVEDTRTPEQKVDDARAIYAREYLKCKKEVRKQVAIDRTKASLSNIFKSKENKKVIKEEDYFTPEFRQAKEVYNRARVEMGNEMFNKKKAEFEDAGLAGADLEQALTQYKATEILSKTILEERQKLINAKAEGTPMNPAAWKKLVNGYMKLPRWQKVALSTILFVGAAGGGLITGGALAGYSLGSMAVVKFGSSMAIGSVTSVAVKGIDFLKRKGDAEFKNKQDNKLSELKNQFASGEITLEQLEEFEKGASNVVEEEKKRARNRVLLKAGVGVAVAGLAGWGVSHGIGSSTHAEAAVNTNPVEHSTPVVTPVTQPPVVENPIIDTQVVEKPVIDTNVVTTPKVEEIVVPKPKVEEIKVIKPHEGVWETGGEKPISPTRGEFETNTDKNISPTKGEFNTGEKTISQTTTVTGKSEFETNTLNTEKPVELSKPINLSDGTSEFEKASTQTTNVDQTIPKTGTSQFETNNTQTAPKTSEFISEKPIQSPTPESEFELKNQEPRVVGNTETITEQPIAKAPTSQFETNNTKIAPEIIDQQTIKTPGVSEFEKINTQPTPGTGIIDQTTPKVGASQFETNSTQTAPVTAIDQGVKTPDINSTVTPNESIPTRVPPGSISPTRGIYNTTANGTENFSNPTALNPDVDANNNGFTRTGNLTANESQIKTEDIGEQIKSGSIYETENGPKTVTMQNIEADGRNMETIKDLKKEIGRHSFKHDVIVVKPVDETINGIEYNKWNDATDYTLKAKNIKFPSYESYEKERELQALFGEGKEVIRGGNRFIDMDYFREAPEWKIVNKIPAKYFFDFENTKEIVGDKLVDIPKADLDKLINSGIIEDQVVEINGVPTHSYTFVNRTELLRLSNAYEQWNSEYARPIGNETIERYVARITRDVHQTDDGTFFVLKKDIVLENNVVDTDGRVVNLEDRAVRNIQRSGNISPTRGVYQTGTNTYSPNYRVASRAASIFSRRMSTPVRMFE